MSSLFLIIRLIIRDIFQSRCTGKRPANYCDLSRLWTIFLCGVSLSVQHPLSRFFWGLPKSIFIPVAIYRVSQYFCHVRVVPGSQIGTNSHGLLHFFILRLSRSRIYDNCSHFFGMRVQNWQVTSTVQKYESD